MAEKLIFHPDNADDRDAVFAVHQSAFGRDEEAQLALELLADPTAQPLLSYGAYRKSKMLAHIMFTKVILSSMPDLPAYLLGPVAVCARHQNKGIGTALIQNGIDHLTAAKPALIFVLGDPQYYARFGFKAAKKWSLTAPYKLPTAYDEAWMVLHLNDDLASAENALLPGQVACCAAFCDEKYWVE